MRKLKIFIIGLTLLSLILPNIFSVEEALAQTKTDYLIAGAVCVGSTALANLAVGWINDGLKYLKGLVPKLFKFLAIDVPTSNNILDSHKELGDTIGRCLARGMMNQMTARMIGAVRTSGRTGEPAFVRDWRRFKLNAQYRGENLFRAMLGSTQLCPYFSGDIKTLFNANNQPNVNTRTMTRVGNLDPFNRRAGCTMPKGWSLTGYRSNFAGNGGWGALNQLAQPQNNYYGNLMMSLAELGVQRLTEEENDLDEAKTALGFTSRRAQNPALTTANGGGYCLNNQNKSCTTNAQCSVASTGGNLPTTSTCIPKRNTCLMTASNGRCIVYSNILTPGSVLQQTATNVIQQELNWLTNVQSLQGFISDLTGLVLSRVLNLSAPDKTPQNPYQKENYGGLEPGLSCPPEGCDTTVPPPEEFCGNGVKDLGEQCDGADLGGAQTCSNIGDARGALMGTLSCSSDCTYDISACTVLVLPDSTAAITVCDSAGTTCLTAQWFKQGKAGATDPTGQCPLSNCVVINHKIGDGSTNANIYRGAIVIDGGALLGASDYPEGTRVDTCMADGNTIYGLATNLSTSVSPSLQIPIGGRGSCLGSLPPNLPPDLGGL